MDTIIIHKNNEVYVNLECERSIAKELHDFFKFQIPGYQYSPAAKWGWDGYIRLFNLKNYSIYAGLTPYIDRFARDREYLVEYEYETADTEFSLKEAQDFIKSLNLKIKPRDYQVEAFVYGVRKRRALFLSPTASGKSLIIYLLVQYYKLPVLIIVPTIQLVHQMANDFVDYGFNRKYIHKIHGGEEKSVNKPVVISTWQSLKDESPEFFERFSMIIGDEAHLFKAKKLCGIMEKLTDIEFRFGFTGTLDGENVHQLILEGLFGSVRKVSTTTELIEQDHLSAFEIKCIVLQHDKASRVQSKKWTYQDEMDFLVRSIPRNNFIKNLALSIEGNTLLLFQYVEKHGQVLYDALKEYRENVFFIHGGVDGQIREDVRQAVENMNDAIIIASYGVFSTGVNIKNLHNVIFASPSKSKIRNLQSIGRVLRKGDNKSNATLFDISDDLINDSKKNFTILHFAERVKIYNSEKFSYKIYNVKLNNKE